MGNMTDSRLPAAIRTFIDATNAGDSDAFVAAFTSDAYLDDWGREFHGRDGVRAWDRTDNIGVNSHFDLVEVEPGDGPDRYVVTLTVSGDGFNGTGPMRFELRDGLIASLVISSAAVSTKPDITAPRRGRGRRPADEVRADVLHAVGELLLREGLADLTFERIARVSGVSKTTLYKWWPSVGALALDGYFHAVEDTLAFPDTGDLRADITTQLRSFAALMTGTPAGRLLTQLIGQSQTDPELAVEYRRLYSSHRRRLAVDRFRRAEAAGQLRPGLDAQVLVDQLWGAVYHRLLIPDEPVTDAFITALIDNLFDGIAAEGRR